MRRLQNRFVLVPLVLAVLVAAWNLYVALHAHGVVAGRVVEADGRPAAGATVILYERDFITQNERGRTTTGPDGGFRFNGNASHLVQLQARQGALRSARVTLRLWFRAQDARLAQPLRLGPG
ncbi:MAG: hypothetical protein BGP12_19630 [Rhodospirillales bacterium 70-18]|nr:MAG: hypothetical protein BGP12_19630 [Rhodospirillales bacterium 70-18]